VNAALDWAKTAGALRTELGVYTFNEAALRFWQSVGFAPLSHRLYKD
jgi:GNAT superfamily N-acetyltransferase